MRHPALLLLPALLLPAGSALADDFVVTRYDDPIPGSCLPTDCSLREAALAANSSASADRILLSAGTYLLNLAGPTGGNVAFTGSTELVGPGATMTFIDSTDLGEVP